MKASQRSTVYKKWLRWIEKIDNDITTLFADRAIWRGVQDILRSNSDLPSSYFTDWMAGGYARSQAVGIRRQATYDRRGRDTSLAALVADIKRHPEVLSRERYVRKYRQGDPFLVKIGHQDFDKLAGKGRSHPTKDQIDRDIKKLQRAAHRIKRYVDTHVAHYDRRPQRKVPTFRGLDEALDALGGVFRKYNSLLRAQARARMEPTFQYDWTVIFTLAWRPQTRSRVT